MNDKKQREDVEPVPRVKINPQYDWTQDTNSLRVRIPILNSNIKNIVVEVTDLILKVNATDKKLVKTLDLWSEVLLEGVSVVYVNNILEVMLLKKNKELWPQLLVEEMNKAELIQRRQESFTRKNKLEQEYIQKVKDLKIEFDSHATREQMRIEDIERNKISEAKQNIKQQALDDIFSSGEQQINIKQNTQQIQIKYDGEPIQVAIDDVEKQEKINELNKKIDEIEEQYRRQPKQAIVTNDGYDKNLNIFDDKDFQKPIVLPEVRKVGGGGAIQLEFTERVYPNLAVREQHYQDAPLPKQNKKFSKDVRENNPLFLKDKGDDFFKNKDYYSAINAYGQAFKGNEQLFSCLTNRALCYLMVFNYNMCISDCDTFLEIYEKDPDKQTKLYKLHLKTLFRKGIALGWKGQLDTSEKIFNQIIQILNTEIDVEQPFKDDMRAQVNHSLLTLQQRKHSQQSKRQGDNFYKTSSYQKAIEYYMKSIQIDQNELAYGNLGLVYLKQENLTQSLTNTDISINIIQRFLNYSNANPNTGLQGSQSDSYDFLLKLYMRKAKCLFLQQNFDDALQAIKSAISIDEMNKEARDILSQIQRSQKRVEALKLKQEATSRLRESNFMDALTLYNECLQKFTPQEDLIDLLEVLLNKCICCMSLEQFDDVLGACFRGLKLITQQKNKVLSFEKLKKEDRQKLNDYHVRFLVRRSNAYIKQNQIYHAKVDLEEALKLDPKNVGIESDLQKIKKII